MDLKPIVALLAEGVDRNKFMVANAGEDDESPSSRRAWIEMHYRHYMDLKQKGRPPRGGRG